MKPKFDIYPSIDSLKLNDFENKFKLVLPQDYKDFICNYNLLPNREGISDDLIPTISFQTSNLILNVAFLGLFDLEFLSVNIENQEFLEEQFRGFLFFAETYPDGAIGMKINDNRIFYLNFNGIQNQYIFKLADNFTEFLHKIEFRNL